MSFTTMDRVAVKRTLIGLECPFSWAMPELDQPVDHFIKYQEEKVQQTEEENRFLWSKFNLDLLLGFELYDKKKNLKAALEHINSCITHLEELIEENCQDQLFCSIKTSLIHVAYATKAHLLMLNGESGKVRPLIAKITLVSQMSKREKAGIFGIQAGVYISYGMSGHRKSLDFAKKAREIDPDQAEWHFIVGNSMGRIRRTENGKISNEEIEAIEKAFCLEEDASYVVHLAALYSERAIAIFYDRTNYQENQEKSKTYAIKATKYFRKAIELRPYCPGVKARAAHGLLRIQFKEVMDIKYIKQLLDDVVRMAPNNCMVYHDLGMYYEKFENNTNKAIEALNKANKLFNYKALLYMITIKWRHQNGLEREIIKDLEDSLDMYSDTEPQAQLLANLAMYSLLISDDWSSAVKYVNRCLKVDPSANYLLACQTLRHYRTNMIQMIRQELRRRPALGRLLASQEFVELTKDKFDSERVTEYSHWKKDQLKSLRKQRY